MIKTLEVSLGQVGALAVGVPVVTPGLILTTGYYTEQTSGQLYYYDAANDQWYYYAAGLLYPLAITWKASPSPKIELAVGDTFKFNLSFKYLGPAVTKDFYAAIGTNSKSGSFDEWTSFNKTLSIVIPAKTSLTLITTSIGIVIPAGHQGEDGAAYCKIMDGFTLTEGVNVTPYYYDVCHILQAAGEFTEFGIVSFVKV